ncbi:MAG: mandelate racemase/muconate lactonizing enzyme family protein [Henriciella sp.]|nr:mandelate racemase/muconate lactonizing enzyme family protein [Henriciella sp.]
MTANRNRRVPRHALRQFSRRTMIWGGLFSPAAANASTIVAGQDSSGWISYPEDPLRSRVIDLHKRFTDPIIIKDIQHLKHSDRTYFMRVESEGGAVGAVKCNQRMQDVSSLFQRAIRPALIGTDARDMEATFESVYRFQKPRGYKYSGLAYFTAQGHAELAIWDMLGHIAGARVADLIGGPRRSGVPVYLTRLTRRTTAQEEVDRLAERIEATGARAVKVKIGGRMSLNEDAFPGRTESLVPALRNAFGDDLTLYVDANGSYDAPTAVRVGHMLQDQGVDLFEEPCPWEDFEMTWQVTQSLDIKVGGGEQDSSLPKWRWMINNRGVDVLQPDLIYNGGILRALKVARMAAAAGMTVTPHYPRWGAEAAPLIHYASVIPNFHGFMEYRADPVRFDFDYTPVFDAVDGEVALPDGPGFGIEYDPKIFEKAEVLTG